jgi:hypothetical protein
MLLSSIQSRLRTICSTDALRSIQIGMTSRWSYDRAARLYHVLIQYTLQTPHGFVADSVCLIDVFVAGVLTYPLRLNMDFNIAFMPYGPTWRHLRREFHINFLLTEMEVSRPFEQRAVHRLLRNFLSSPNDFSKHLRQ